MNHSRTCAEVVAIAVTESKQNPSKQLIDVFFYNLSKDDLNTALRIVLQQMNTLDFLNTIVSVKSLNVLEMRKHAIAPSAETNETSPIVPGVLSEAS